MVTSSRILTLCLAFALLTLVGCGGGAGEGGGTSPCSGSCPSSTAPQQALTVSEVETVIAQAVQEARARGAAATIAVVDRVGNVLGVFRMTGAAPTFTITGQRGVHGGLEEANVLPSEFAAIAKAITGAYLSSAGNAFTSRTASQIVQQNFNPGEVGSPGGPLFGVQFSQLSCSDLMRRASHGSVGPKRSPLGLAADPGGIPLYKGGTLVGGIGVIADAIYSLDLNVLDVDTDVDELVALAGTHGFDAPGAQRADRITADGRTLRFVDRETLAANPQSAPGFASINGTQGVLVAVPGYGAAVISAGVAFGTPASGYRADVSPAFAGLNAYVLVDATDTPRYPPVAGTDGMLTAAEVTTLLAEAIRVANRARAQLRRPLGSTAQVTVSVVDTNGTILGLLRSPDAPVFGTDVAVQKARTALFFSHPNAAGELAALAPADYLAPNAPSPITAYLAQIRAFLANPVALSDGIAYSTRAVGNFARPYYPDGINGSSNGPFSKPFAGWSPFNDGLQLDLVFNVLIASALGAPTVGCTGLGRVANGIQIFPGGLPIFRRNQLVGAIGVSGDGVDQDDMVAALGLANAGAILGTGIANAPPAIRADTIVPPETGAAPRYLQCPLAPFNDSTATNVCDGI